jgi:heavy metal translocating P-type ATPase
VNEASITGEAEPAFKESGASVFSGTVSLDGRLVIRAIGVGEDRMMARLVRLLRDALSRRAPVQRLADRVSAIFVPLTALIAVAAFVFWSWRGGTGQGLLVALAVLLVACPCALGVATPLAIWAGMGRAAEGGVLIRSAEVLEKLSGVKVIFFDKTGTLTKGTLQLQDVKAGEGVAVESVIERAVSLETASEHSLGRAMVSYAHQHRIAPKPIRDFRALPGLGVRGFIEESDTAIGSGRFMERLGWRVSQALTSERTRLEAEGRTVTLVGWGGEVYGLLAFAEAVRPEAPETVKQLIASGLAVEGLTGDDRPAGEALARHLGIRVHANLLPEDKERLIGETRERLGPVAMVGDGLNDAPALARADVGIALGCGVDVTRETADASLIGSDLRQVAWTLELARETYRTIRQNLWWAFFYNVLGIALALAGVLHPIVSAIAMVVSNLFVVGNSLRLARRTGPEEVERAEKTFVEEFAVTG